MLEKRTEADMRGAAVAVLLCALAIACNDPSTHAAPPATSPAEQGQSEASAPHRDAGNEAAVSVDGDADDLGSPIDAPTIEKKPGLDTVCESELAWWTVGVEFDGSTPIKFATELNTLLATPGDHAFTIADQR